MRQLRLIPSGVQQIHKQGIATSPSFFAFCSSTAVYIYRCSDASLKTMLVSAKRAIALVVWHPADESCIATISVQGLISFWNIDSEAIRWTVQLSFTTSVGKFDWHPCCASWDPAGTCAARCTG